MKKLIALAFAMVFLATGLASATDFSLTGSYYARGTYADNWDGVSNAGDQRKYDHELSVDATWQIDDNTKVFARIEMRDEDWGDATSTHEGDSIAVGDNVDDNIAIERVYGQYTFAHGGTLRLGLMGAGTWATAFGDWTVEEYRVWYSVPTAIGQVFAILGKPKDTGESDTVDKENNSYALALVTKIGGISVKPLLKYVDNEFGGADTEVFAALLGFDGTFGNVGFEAEFIYKDYDIAAATDFDIWGAYLNVWAQMDALKIGGLIAYGSYDDDVHRGFGFGDDFAAGGALLLGDDVFNAPDELSAMTLVALYLNYAVSEKLSFGAYAGYADSNVDNPGNAWDGANLWELSCSASYKITDNVTYSVAAGTAQVEYGNNTPDPDAAVEIYHKFAFSF